MSEHSLFNSLLTLRASNISVFHYLPLQEKNENLTIRLHASSKAGFILQDLITNRKILRQVSKAKFAGFLISRNQLIYANDLTAKSKYSILAVNFHLHIPFYWFKTQLWRRTSSSTPAYKLKCCAIRINRVYLLNYRRLCHTAHGSTEHQYLIYIVSKLRHFKWFCSTQTGHKDD